jgi:hypothetical protein
MVASAQALRTAAGTGNYVRGDWTTEMRQERKWVRELLRSVLKLERP